MVDLVKSPPGAYCGFYQGMIFTVNKEMGCFV